MSYGPDDLNELRKLILPKLVRTATIQSAVIFLLVISQILTIYLAVTKAPQVISVTETGRVIPIVPLDKPYIGDARVIGFADECVRMAFSHDFLNFRASMGAVKGCFTGAGGTSFDKAIEPLIKDLEQRRMVMTPTLQPAVIAKTMERAGVYTWVVQTKMTLFREGTKERVMPTTYVVDVIIERVPLEESVRGIAVSQINVRPG